jgi:hypothetical protein
VLRVVELAGDVVLLGRYHLAPPATAAPVVVQRRVSGGRVAAAGAGFVGVTLVLPHRSALVASEPLTLAPEQVPNRCVRGILAGLESLGVPAVYPGRDAMTAGGRTIALLGFDVDAAGALLFEAIVGVGRDLTALPALLDAVDPGGVVPAAMWTAADATSVARETGRTPSLDELAAAIRRGYETRMGLRFVPASGDVPSAPTDAGWLRARAPRPDLDRRATAAAQLGMVAVDCARDGDRLREVMVSGDLLADSPAVARLEAELRGVAVEAAAVHATVARAFAPPVHFLLGITPSALGDLILQAAT